MKKILFAIYPFLAGTGLFGQVPDTLTLEQCYQLAVSNHPLARQSGLFEESSSLKVRNINKNWLPQVNISGNASLQSDVTEFSIPRIAGLPPIESPEISPDWYKLTLDVNQAIYDGNVNSYSRRMEKFNLQSDKKSLEVELYRLRERVNQVFFSILLLRQNEAVLVAAGKQLQAKLDEIRSGVENGTILRVNAELLQAELIRNDQQLTEARMDRTASVNMLSELISVPVDDNAVMKVPEIGMNSFVYENHRPENDLFTIQQSRVLLMKDMVTTKWNPKLFAYGSAGIARPGYNFLSNDFTGIWIVGARLTWTPWNWNQNRNEKQVLMIQKDILRTQQESFDRNQKISVQKDLSDIVKYSDLLLRDEEIILLRMKITATASSQLENGVITSSDYISRLNEETLARLNREIHRIQLVRSKVSFLYNTGQ